MPKKKNVLIFKTRALGFSDSPLTDGFGKPIKPPVKKEQSDDLEIIIKLKNQEPMPKAA